MKKINTRKLYYHLRYRYLTLNNIVVFVAFCIAASWAWGSVGVMERNYALQREVDTKYRQQQLLELETATLSYQQRYFKSEEYQELAVRERLGLARSGEKALILPPNSQVAKESDGKAAKANSTVAVTPSNFEQWMNFLLGGNSKSLK